MNSLPVLWLLKFKLTNKEAVCFIVDYFFPIPFLSIIEEETVVVWL